MFDKKQGSGKVKKNLHTMEKVCQQWMQKVLAQVTCEYKVINTSEVPQILNYFGTIHLTEMQFEKKELISIGTHLERKYLHIMLINASIGEILKEYKKIQPVAIFTVKYDDVTKLSLQPSRLDKVFFGQFSKRMFEVYIKTQKVLFESSAS